MRKTDKKLDNLIRQRLTEVCDFALQNCDGYQWITHNVNYSRFPESLIITCMFSDAASTKNAKQNGELLALIQEKLLYQPINIKLAQKQVVFKSQ